MSYLVVFLGAGLGGALRHGVNRFALDHYGPAYPYGTLIVNIAGGFLTGALAELFLARTGGSQEWRLFLTTGILGGFTTFSAFSLDAALMMQRGNWWALTTYVSGSVIMSIVARFLGMTLVRAAI